MENVTSNGTETKSYEYYYENGPALTLWSFIPEGYEVVRDFMYRYVTFTIWLISLFGNLLVIGILLRRRNRTFSTSIYLTGLAFADLFLNTSESLYIWLVYSGYLGTVKYSDLDCKLRNVIPFAVQFISPWMLAVISIERVISVCLPHKIKRLCTTSAARVITLAVWVLFLGLGVAHENMLEFIQIGGIFGACFVSAKYRDIYFKYIVWAAYILKFIVPYFIILLSTIIIRILLLRRKFSESKTVKSVNIILINVNTVFLILNTPYIIVYMFAEDIIFDTYELKEWAYYYFWTEMLKIVMNINSAVNFFVYFISGSRFRGEVWELLCKCNGCIHTLFRTM